MLCFQKGKVSVPNVLNIFLSLEIHYSNMVPGAVYLYDFFFQSSLTVLQEVMSLQSTKLKT